MATIVTCVWPATLAGAVYVALFPDWLEMVPSGFPNATCKLQVTAELSETATVTVRDCPGSIDGLVEGVTNSTGD